MTRGMFAWAAAGLLLAIGGGALGATLVWVGIGSLTPDALAQVIVGGVTTLAAAFVGAWYAFRLTDEEKARDTRRAQLAAINRTQFVLVRQIDVLKTIRRQIIDPQRNNPGRWLAMRPMLDVDAPPLFIDFDGLLFLFEKEDHRGFPQELMVEQQRYATAIEAVKWRSKLHLEQIQPRLAAAQVPQGEVPIQLVTNALGLGLVATLQTATDAVISNVDSTIDSHFKLAERFYEAMKQLFPEEKTVIRPMRLAENE